MISEQPSNHVICQPLLYSTVLAVESAVFSKKMINESTFNIVNSYTDTDISDRVFIFNLKSVCVHRIIKQNYDLKRIFM